MAISTTCPQCQSTLQFDDSQAHLQGSCPRCGATFVIPAVAAGGSAFSSNYGSTGQVYGGVPPHGTGQPHSSGHSYGAGTSYLGSNPYAAGHAPPGYAYGSPVGGHYAPHRGGAVLTLGILGLLICFILGIIAWVMGSADLKEMQAGRMDPSGMGITQAGMICGMISSILGGIVVLVYLMLALASIWVL